MYQILFRLPDDREILVDKVKCKQSILDVALDNNIDIDTLCGGAGVCRECVIAVERGEEFFEKNRDAVAGIKQRYACQSILSDGSGALIVAIH